MLLCKVRGTLVATQKNKNLQGYKILITQPINLEGNFIGRDILAIDVVDAGRGDTVLVIQEGAVAQQLLKRKDVPVHSIIVAVVDNFEAVE